MADPAKMRAELEELRAVGDRLMLGDPDARKVRGFVCDVLDVLLGRTPNHDDVNVSGARAQPIEASRFAVGPGGQHLGPPGVRPHGGVYPARGGSDAETIAEIERMAAEARIGDARLAEAASKPAGQPAPALSIGEALEIAAAKKKAALEKSEEASSTTTPNGG
jgi:hypothetical protein